MSRVLVVGLNPAWQRVVDLPYLNPGRVQRARESRELASGKGINAAKALRRLGHDVSVLQVLGGENGKRCLAECEKLGLRSLHAWVASETRVCTTLRHGTGTTEIIEPFAAAETDLGERLIALAAEAAAPDALVISGSVPSGLSPSVHGSILAAVQAPVVIWDSVAGLDAAHFSRIAWIKVNAAEYAELRTAIRDLGPGVPSILITSGPDPALVRNSNDGDGIYRIPALSGVQNPIGAGDAVSAGLADGVLRGLSAEKAVRRALALGAASCLTPRPAEWDAARALAIAEEIRMEPA